MDNDELALLAARRSGIFWLLAELVVSRPSAVIVDSLCNDFGVAADRNARGSIVGGLLALRDALPPQGNAVAIDALAAEHTRLFGGIKAGYGPPPPHESVHREAVTPADVFTDVLQCYADAGFGGLREAALAPDHLGMELKFLALLCHKEMEAWRSGAGTEAIDALRRQREFLDSHLMVWAPQFWALVKSQAQHLFYRALSAFALDALTEENAIVGELLVDYSAA